MIRTSSTVTITHEPENIEVAHILGRHIQDYEKKYPVLYDQNKAVQSILNCRTEALGGHIEMCNECGFVHHAYHSCRNRHCPKCQTLTKEKWLEARKTELLPIKYFHAVFTLPHEINPIALYNKYLIYSLLFKAATRTLKQFGKNPKHNLEGDIGITTILHTWDQKLNHHIHIHCLVPGGALSFDKTEWKFTKGNFLFPVKALSSVFRGKFMDYLKRLFEEGKLEFPGSITQSCTKQGFKQLTKTLWAKKWVVYAKPPFEGPEQVLEYIGRYTHRIAISNDRIKSLKDGQVTFSYKNRKAKKKEFLKPDALEFIRRFLLHVLPPGFMRIRHYGILANRYKKKNLSICREILGLNPELPEVEEKSIQDMMRELTGKDITQCPKCKKGKMVVVAEIPDFKGIYRSSWTRRVTVKEGST